jgi:hypothetical protein
MGQQQQQQQPTNNLGLLLCCILILDRKTNFTCVQQIHREHAQPRIWSQGMNSSVPKTQNSGEEEINQTQRERHTHTHKERERERESLQNWQHKYNQILSATLN